MLIIPDSSKYIYNLQRQSAAATMMQLSIDPEVFRVLVTCTCILVAKMLFTNFYSFIPSALNGFGPPEDSWFVKPLSGVEQTHGTGSVSNNKRVASQKKSRAMIRAQRIVQNDLENIPIALVAFWMAGFATASSTSGSQEIVWLAQIFAVTRVMHTLTYLMCITLVRSGVFMVGYLSVFRALHLSWSTTTSSN